jgi:hypothetical protein
MYTCAGICVGKMLEFCGMQWKLREFYGSSEVLFLCGCEGGRERE